MLLILMGFILGLAAAGRMSLTVDELYHLTGGVAYWKTGDYRMHPENGNLPQLLAAWPLTFMDLRLPPRTNQSWRTGDMLQYGRELFFDLGNDPRLMLMAGRAMIGMVTLAIWATIYLTTFRFFGRPAALISLSLSVLCPTLLSHGFLATSDACVTLFFLLSMLATAAALQKPSALRLIAASIAVAGLCLSKFSAPLLIPMMLILMAIFIFAPPQGIGRGRAAIRSLIIGLLTVGGALLTIWASYGFRYSTASQIAYPWEEMAGSATLPMHAVFWARDRHLLPEAYLYGQTHTLRFSGERLMYLNGRYSTTGWPHYFLYTTLVKTPLGTLAIWLPAAASILFCRRRMNWGLPHAALLILPAIYSASAMLGSINIGHRHFLPVIPAMMIFAGAGWALAQTKILRRLMLAAIAATVGQSISCWPDYLPFTNGLAGGPTTAWRHLVDSNIDWGQDMDRLKLWLEKQKTESPQIPVHLSWFSPMELPEKLTDRRLLNTFPYHRSELTGNFIPRIEPGIYCLSVNLLTGVYHPLLGPWTPGYESRYQQALPMIDQLNAIAGDDAIFKGFLGRFGLDNVRYFNALREGRLLAYLRQRDPVDRVGHSFMIYRVTAGELERALHGPAPELRAEISKPPGAPSMTEIKR